MLANSPFNVDDVSLEQVEKDKRFNTYGVPRNKGKGKKGDEAKETVPNGNYLWINLFATWLKPAGRAALVMANSASDARHSEADSRRTLVEKNLIYGMLTLPSNLFYTVTLPAALWFFDKAKADERVLFIDARNVFTQVDRAHPELSEEQIQNIAIIPRLHKGRQQEFVALIDRYFQQGLARLVDSQAHIPALAERLLAGAGRGRRCAGRRGRPQGRGAPGYAMGEPGAAGAGATGLRAGAWRVGRRGHAEQGAARAAPAVHALLHRVARQPEAVGQGHPRDGQAQGRRQAWRRQPSDQGCEGHCAGAARRGDRTPFFVSANEARFARDHGDRFHLYRLFEFRTCPRLFELAGPIEQHCLLDAVTFRASFG